MGANTYAFGDGFRLQAQFTVNSVLTDPTTVVFKLKLATGVIQTYTYGIDPEIIKSAVGIYYMDISADCVGQCWYRVEGTGAVIAAHEYPFICVASQF